MKSWLLRIRERARGALHATTGASLALGFAAAAAETASTDATQRLRDRMVEEVATMARETGRETGRPQFSTRVMAAMRRVERHRFVPPAVTAQAYENRPLPIGNGQTISQPYIVALSTDLLDVERAHRVLEIGTGSGYQAAVLAELVAHVDSIEIIEPLGRDAAKRLNALGYRNVEVRIGDGYAGWPERAPYDRILVTAAAPSIPEPLVTQLARGGRMVIPVGGGVFGQQLVLVEKDADGTVRRKDVLAVRFVPLVRPKPTSG